MKRWLLGIAFAGLIGLPFGSAAAQDSGPYAPLITVGRGAVRSVAWSPRGDVIAVGGALGIWLYTPELGDIGLLTGHTKAVYGLAFSPDGSRLASASHDRTVRVWDITAAQATGAPPALLTFEGHTGLVVTVDWSPDGSMIASGSYDRTVRLWNPDTGDAPGVLEGHTGWVSDVAFSPDGSRLASASYDGTIRLWDTTTWEPVAVLDAHAGPVLAAAWNWAGHSILGAGWDGAVREWSLPEGGAPILAQTFQAHDDVIYDVAWNPQGFTFATAGWDGAIRNWYTRDWRQVGEFAAHTGRADHLAWNPDGTMLASVGWDDTVRVWDVSRDREHAFQPEHLDWITAAVWIEGRVCALTSRAWMACWDAESGASSGAFLSARMTLSFPVIPSPDGSREAVIDEGGGVTVRDTASGAVIAALPGRANAAAWDEAGARLAVARRNGTIQVWGAAE